MSSKGKVHGRTRLLLWWPIFLIPIVFALTVAIAFLNQWSLYIALIFVGAYLIFCLWWVIYWRKKLEDSMRFFAEEFQEIQSEQLNFIPVPAVMVDEDGYTFWSNEAFDNMCGGKRVQNIRQIQQEVLDSVHLFMRGEEIEGDFVKTSIDGREYHVVFRYSGEFATLWFFDETKYYEKIEIIDNMQPAVAHIFFDNYEDVTSNAEEVKKPLIIAMIEKKVSDYFRSYGATVHSIEKDKYVANFNNKALRKMQEDKFSILEAVKSEEIDGVKIGATLSIGIGADGVNLSENYSFSKLALSLCLGRGGDQVVIRRPNGSTFFGGKTEKTDKSTSVRARVVARALEEILKTKNRVIVMGHNYPDADALGAAVGVYKIAKTYGKEARIVLEEVPSSVKPIYDALFEQIPAGEKMFVKKSEAKDFCIEDTLLVVVDVNRPSITEYPELISIAPSVAVIDHHRQGEETIEGATLSYIEPYASSASELVTEICEYIPKDIALNKAEAEALYAGIIIDTDNFLTKTGARTFEAAAFLRRHGADMSHVRKFFRESMEAFKARAQAVNSIEIFKNSYAIGRCDAFGLESPTIIGAQAANELLDIKGVKASFVFTPYNGKIFVSARSIDEVNVQLVMEKLGGGGHLSVAGAQIEGMKLEEAIEMTKDVLEKMIDEGEI